MASILPNFITAFFNKDKKSLVDTPEGYRRCLEVINLILDGEADDEQKSYFEQKIKCCQKSMKHYEVEKCVKEVIQEKIDKKPVPPELLDKIKSVINTI